jgi:type VI secretion system protein ImpC
MDRFQREIPKSRVSIALDLNTGGSRTKVDLPLKLLVAGDFSAGKEQAALARRKKINIDMTNFEAVLSDLSPELNVVGANPVAHGGSEPPVSLSFRFRSMRDFEPEKVARQIPELQAMLAMRNLLRDVKSNPLDNNTFDREFERILKGDGLSQQLREELAQIKTSTGRPDDQGVSALFDLVGQTGKPADNFDKSLLDFHIGQLDKQIGEQLDAVLHAPEFQALESRWRGLRMLVERTDFRKNVRIEVLDVSKDALMRDFEDAPEVTQSGLFRLAYIEEYDTPGGEPISAIISDFEFTNSPQDVSLLRNISKVAAAAHMPFIGSVGPAFFGKQSMEEVVAIPDIDDYFDRPEYTRWNGFRAMDDARYVGLTMPRVLGRLPYSVHNASVRSFNYQETVRSADRSRYLWVNASFAFALNMVRSFTTNGWCVQIRGPQAGGNVYGLPAHRYGLGIGAQQKIPTEVLIPETREFEFASLGFIPLSFYKSHDFACFYSANSVQKPVTHESEEATANSRINARLPYILLLSNIAHYLKLIQRENIGATKDRRLLELELNNWIRGLVTEMKDPGDVLQASHPLREARVTVEDIEDNPGYFRIKLFIVPHFQVEGMDVELSLVSQMPRAKADR